MLISQQRLGADPNQLQYLLLPLPNCTQPTHSSPALLAAIFQHALRPQRSSATREWRLLFWFHASWLPKSALRHEWPSDITTASTSTVRLLHQAAQSDRSANPSLANVLQRAPPRGAVPYSNLSLLSCWGTSSLKSRVRF